MQLNEDVYLVLVPMTFGGQTSQLNLTLIPDAAHGPTLVDTSTGPASIVVAALAEDGVNVADLKRIILTHQDVDHIGGLHDLVAQSGARTLAHEIEAPYIEGAKPLFKLPPPQVLDQMPQLRDFINRLQPTPIDQRLQDGAYLDLAGGVRVIFTPGHTPGHISLYLERTKTLISGDALTANDGQLMGFNERATPDVALAWQSVRKLAELDVKTIVCYHGGVVSEDANGQLRRLARSAPAPQ